MADLWYFIYDKLETKCLRRSRVLRAAPLLYTQAYIWIEIWELLIICCIFCFWWKIYGLYIESVLIIKSFVYFFVSANWITCTPLYYLQDPTVNLWTFFCYMFFIYKKVNKNFWIIIKKVLTIDSLKYNLWIGTTASCLNSKNHVVFA